MQLVSGREGSDAFTRRIARLTDGVKRNIEYKRQFMEWERQKTYLFNKGKEEGMQEKAVEAARNLIKMKLGTFDQIAQAQGLPLEEVQKIAEELVTEEA